MISEEYLQNLEMQMNSKKYVWHKEIETLIAEVRELQSELNNMRGYTEDCIVVLQDDKKILEKEADWLAKKASAHSPCIAPYFDCLAADQLNQCHICWREEARKAVEDK